MHVRLSFKHFNLVLRKLRKTNIQGPISCAAQIIKNCKISRNWKPPLSPWRNFFEEKMITLESCIKRFLLVDNSLKIWLGCANRPIRGEIKDGILSANKQGAGLLQKREVLQTNRKREKSAIDSYWSLSLTITITITILFLAIIITMLEKQKRFA